MSAQTNDLEIAWWMKNIEELDRELGRLCLLCQVRIFDHGVIERVLRSRFADLLGKWPPA